MLTEPLGPPGDEDIRSVQALMDAALRRTWDRAWVVNSLRGLPSYASTEQHCAIWRPYFDDHFPGWREDTVDVVPELMQVYTEAYPPLDADAVDA